MKIASNFSFQHEQVRRAEPAGEAGRPQHKGRHQWRDHCGEARQEGHQAQGLLLQHTGELIDIETVKRGNAHKLDQRMLTFTMHRQPASLAAGNKSVT